MVRTFIQRSLTYRALVELGEVGSLFWKTLRNLLKKPREHQTFLQQLEEIGVRSLPPICCPNMTERLTVGSVETMVVLYPRSANQTAVAVAIVVLPTPPLPPKSSS